MKTIQIAPDLKLPLDTVVQRKAIIAKNRVGKSNLGCAYVEEVHKAGVQSVVLDPKGDWYGIRSSADGKGPGLPFLVMGGDQGDVPLDPSAGAALGSYFGANHVDAILDVSDFSKRDVARFGADFFESIYDARKKNRVPLNLVLEEAEDFAPQQIFDKDPNQYRCLGAVNKIAKKAGFLGIGLLLIAQRAASLNKNTLSQADAIFFMRTTAPQDIKAADAWLQDQDDEKRKEVLTHIQGLPTGAAYVWAPEHGIFQKVQIRRRTTFDAGFTPKVGETKPEPKVKAMVDLKALMGQMADIVEKAKADDPAVLKAEIAKLRKDLAARKPDIQVQEKIIEGPPTPTVPIGFVRSLEGLQHSLGELLKVVPKDGVWPHGYVRDPRQPVEELVQTPPPPRKALPARPVNHAKPARVVMAKHADSGLERVQQKILNEMASLVALGFPEPDRVQLALFAGYTNARSGGFSEPLGALIAEGYLHQPQPGHVAFTKKGEQAAQVADSVSTSEQLQQKVLSRLDGPHAKILGKLIECYPNALPRADLAAETGYSNPRSGGFSEPLGKLVALHLVDTPGAGMTRASQKLFLEA